MTKIKVRNNESLEQALRRFNNEVKKAGILQELKDRAYYVKPSEHKRKRGKDLAYKILKEKARMK